MNLDKSWLSNQARRLSGNGLRLQWILLLPVLVIFALVCGSGVSAQVPLKKDVLILNQLGLSHSQTNAIAQQVVTGVGETPGHNVEFYLENLDMLSPPESPSLLEVRNWLAKKYGDHNLDVVVAVGPGAIDFLSNYGRNLFLDIPIVICGASADQLGNPRLDSRFTGTWVKLEPEKTLEVALRLFPDTRHVFVVGGQFRY